MTRHSVNGSGVSIPEQNEDTKSADEQSHSRADDESHITNDVCRFAVGYVLQLNPVTVPQLSMNLSGGTTTKVLAVENPLVV